MSEPKYYASRFNSLLYRVSPGGAISCAMSTRRPIRWRSTEVFGSIESINVLLKNGVIVETGEDFVIRPECEKPA